MESKNKSQSNYDKSQRIKKVILISGIIIAFGFSLVFLAFKISPWPSALLIRNAFNNEGIKVNEELQKQVPGGITELLNQHYDITDEDSKLDIYYPSDIADTEKKLPVIIWIHGGALISGSKEQVASYCKILASKGFIVAAIDYSLAPEYKYPKPLKQTNAALAYLRNNARRFNIDTDKFILAGDSGGAHIASQTGNIIVDSDYAALIGISPAIRADQLRGLILYCGPYDIENINLESGFGDFLKTVLWSYSGKKNFAEDSLFKTASIIKYIGSDYPPCFISAGNGDPLLVQSRAFAKKLFRLNIKADTLFFPPDLKPALPHEYQFDLDTDEGKLALERSVEFLKEITN